MDELKAAHKSYRKYNDLRPVKKYKCVFCGEPCSRKYCDEHRVDGIQRWQIKYAKKHQKRIRRYQKKYRAAHKEKAAAYQKKYRERLNAKKENEQ